MNKSVSVLGGTLFIYLCSLIAFEIPGSNIPQTAQTFGVLVVAALLSQFSGFLAIALYLLIGALGIPVFADGTMGLEVFLGPTRGYLAGFIFAALWCGWWFNQNQKTNKYLLSSMTVMLLAHALILILGWLWLASIEGPMKAYQQGVAPFFLGAAVKSLLASLFVVGYFRFIKNN